MAAVGTQQGDQGTITQEWSRYKKVISKGGQEGEASRHSSSGSDADSDRPSAVHTGQPLRARPVMVAVGTQQGDKMTRRVANEVVGCEGVIRESKEAKEGPRSSLHLKHDTS